MEDTIKNVFLSLQGQEPRADVLARWSVDVSRGTRSIDDLQKYLMRSREYEQHVTGIYRNLYTKYIDDKPSLDLLKTIMSNNIGVPITETIIMDALRSTDAFVKRYHNIITSLWKIIKGEDIDAPTLQFFLDRFKDEAYTVASLQKDIVNNSSAPTKDLTHPVEDIADVLGAGVPLEDFSKVLDIMHSPRLAAELFLASCDIANHPKIKTAVSVYPTFFSRDITVVELLRIFPSLLATLDVEGLVRSEHQRFSMVFDAFNNAYTRFTGSQIDHMAFINNHLSALDEPELMTVVGELVLTLTRSPKYKDLIMKQLTAMNGSCDKDDLEQIFTVIMVSCIGCNELDKIKSIFTDYFTNRDAYIQSVSNIYEENLGRGLEPDEVQKYSQYYRDHKSDLSVVKQDVQSSFEYIGVMHEMIANLAKDLGVADRFGRGKLYKLIESLMNETEDKSSVTLLAKAREQLLLV